MSDLEQSIDARSPRAIAFDLFLASVAGLFIELFLIRHLGTEVRVMAYFQNSVLIACFIGLGIGFRYARRPPLRFGWFVPALAVVLALVLAAVETGLVAEAGNPSGAEYHWGPPPTTRGDIIFYVAFVLVFGLVLGLFALVGQVTGNLFVRLPSLRAYAINVAGSIAGIAAFTALSFLGMRPWVWVLVAMLPALALLRGRTLGIGAGFAAAVVALYAGFGDAGGEGGREVFWSPYQKVVKSPLVQRIKGLAPLEVGFEVSVNQDYHQLALNLSDAFYAEHGASSPGLSSFREVYGFPYRIKPKPGRVLVVGAGTGNDVAAALRAGAGHVDAVEIDPVIADLGRRHHPERPYDDPRVTLIVDDARAYLRRTTERYDLIVYGLLDSHTQISGMVQVRLDNFVYTVEAFQEARRSLTDGGALALSFAANPRQSWIPRRIFAMLHEVFGEDAIAIHDTKNHHAVFLAGPGIHGLRLPSAGTFIPLDFADEAPVEATRDDWPFFYMQGRGIPVTYGVLLAVIGVFFLGIYRTTALRTHTFSSHFFFLGAAFLLVEVKGITELALVFGTTWVVNAIAITTILALILGATLWIARHPVSSLWPAYIGLWASLLVGFALPTGLIASWPLAVQQAVTIGLLFLPVLFAAVIFGTSLDRTTDVEGAFSSNLLGAMGGGFCEYLSLVTGIKALYLVALVLYVASAYGVLFRRRSS